MGWCFLGSTILFEWHRMVLVSTHRWSSSINYYKVINQMKITPDSTMAILQGSKTFTLNGKEKQSSKGGERREIYQEKWNMHSSKNSRSHLIKRWLASPLLLQVEKLTQRWDLTLGDCCTLPKNSQQYNREITSLCEELVVSVNFSHSLSG